jgi:hypothetical protein
MDIGKKLNHGAFKGILSMDTQNKFGWVVYCTVNDKIERAVEVKVMPIWSTMVTYYEIINLKHIQW